jgi:hypothetical protein
MAMPVPVKVVFEDGEEQTARVDRTREVDVLVFRSRTRLREAVLDPERKLAMLENRSPSRRRRRPPSRGAGGGPTA